MSGSYEDDRFGARHRGGSGMPGGGLGGALPGGLWDALDQLRDAFEQRLGGVVSGGGGGGGGRVSRGDVRAAGLALLAEQPMHGYQIIHEIEERSNGSWKPSPGSVYPTLQLLADEGLITAEEANGKKTYSLTDAGRAEAETSGSRSAPWESTGMGGMGGMG